MHESFLELLVVLLDLLPVLVDDDELPLAAASTGFSWFYMCQLSCE